VRVNQETPAPSTKESPQQQLDWVPINDEEITDPSLHLWELNQAQ
jgi:hypothetical protein